MLPLPRRPIVDDDGAFVGLDDGRTSGRLNDIDVTSGSLNTLGVCSRRGGDTHCQYEAHEARHVAPSVQLHGFFSPWLISILPLPVWMTAGPPALSIRLTSRPAVGTGFCVRKYPSSATPHPLPVPHEPCPHTS